MRIKPTVNEIMVKEKLKIYNGKPSINKKKLINT